GGWGGGGGGGWGGQSSGRGGGGGGGASYVQIGSAFVRAGGGGGGGGAYDGALDNDGTTGTLAGGNAPTLRHLSVLASDCGALVGDANGAGGVAKPAHFGGGGGGGGGGYQEGDGGASGDIFGNREGSALAAQGGGTGSSCTKADDSHAVTGSTLASGEQGPLPDGAAAGTGRPGRVVITPVLADPGTDPGTGAGAAAVPTLGEWALALLGLLLGALGLRGLGRR
ncbi:IPTL-CTERM sorting domain-containing protein, partial [Ottowia sp.]|uniref:IPTL-CTERM sorting domain-containing protein n=1 Tax=Ottowia sp. TaxID=1898956 RepID=UPI0039E70048